MGSETILPIITAVVLGDTYYRGKGSIIGTVLASIFIGLMQYGLQMTGLTNEQSNVVIGIILILSVIMRHFKLHQFTLGKERICIRGNVMKRKLGIVFIVCICLIGLIACSSQTADKKKADDVKFAFIPKLTGVGFFTSGGEGAKEMGIN